MCGASVAQVGTATFWDPLTPRRLVGELEHWLEKEGLTSARELVGTLKLNE